MISHFVLFGATGDLATRQLFPALAELADADMLPSDFTLTATSEVVCTDQEFKEHIRQHLADKVETIPPKTRKWLVERCNYHQCDVTQEDQVQQLLARQPVKPAVYYLALPSQAIASALRALAQSGLAKNSRIAIEKPFGYDAEDANRLADIITELFGEDTEQTIFNVDHILGNQRVQALLGVRLMNPMLEGIWNSAYIAELRIMWEETLGIEGRAAFYDATGALKDVLQNHLLQLLALCAMEPPNLSSKLQVDPKQLRDHKIDLLRAVRVPSAKEAVLISRRAQYTQSRSQIGVVSSEEYQPVPAYVSEAGVDPSSQTETFAEVILEVDTARWRGTKFRLRTGKALAAVRKGIEIHFRPATDSVQESTLWIGLNGPNTIELRLSSIDAHDQVTEIPLVGEQPEASLRPYANVLKNCLNRGTDLAVSIPEALLAWQIVTPILKAWEHGTVPLEKYPAGISIPYTQPGEPSPNIA